MQQHFLPTIARIAKILTDAGIAYCVIGPAGLAAQGVSVPGLTTAEIAVQWDLFDRAQSLFPGGSLIEHRGDRASYSVTVDGLPVHLVSFFNYVIATDPDRISVEQAGVYLYVQSALGYRRRAPADDPLLPAISHYLAEQQAAMNTHNAAAWTENPYDAWVNRYGSPDAAAAKLKRDPHRRIAHLAPHLGALQSRRVINLMGSQGHKGVAMALLGADVTVVDISPENARYARELALAADVPLRYIVADVLTLPQSERTHDYDIVLMELGILHYFIDLEPLFQVVADLLKPGGRLVLQDFHPVSTKLITSSGKKHKVTGDYFEEQPVDVPIAYTGYLSDPQQAPKARLRRWTLGEVVTAVANAGLRVRTLEEEPNHKLDDIGLPKTFTLVAERLIELVVAKGAGGMI